MVPCVIDRQALQPPFVQPINPGIANMGRMEASTAQDERREGCRHPGQLGIAATLGNDPAIQRGGHRFNGAWHAPGIRCCEIIGQQAAHRVFGGFAAALVAADPVGNRRDNALVVEFRAFRRGNSAEILVPLARAGQRGISNGNL